MGIDRWLMRWLIRACYFRNFHMKLLWNPCDFEMDVCLVRWPTRTFHFRKSDAKCVSLLQWVWVWVALDRAIMDIKQSGPSTRPPTNCVRLLQLLLILVSPSFSRQFERQPSLTPSASLLRDLVISRLKASLRQCQEQSVIMLASLSLYGENTMWTGSGSLIIYPTSELSPWTLRCFRVIVAESF